MGKLIQRLLWVFLNQRIDPYRMLYWTEDFIECTLSLQAEKIMRYGDSFYYSTREQGIFQFTVCIEEDLSSLIEGRFVKVFCRDHAYTLTHFQEEHQKIHQTENKIENPKRKLDVLHGSDGFIRVEILVSNWEYAPYIRYAAG